MFSILHITDLHRSTTDPISNPELLSALISDRERYERESPPIRAPDAIVVSGDLIQGVGLDAADYEQELSAQYTAAYQFIVSLTERFLGGDRSKVVIVPGNHDIDWNAAFASMEVVSDAKPPKLPEALYEPGSPYRWDWKSRQL
ncbi:metallophosphoesterase family protein, partial [Escherichia coli]|uniref:metallophosphoesterase family protein n=1 Tax=Escherichia coli TaxID=562 RepID=UPI0011D9FDF6